MTEKTKLVYEAGRTVPDGYLEDAAGRLVPLENVRERDKLCDGVVRELFAEAAQIASAAAEFKGRAFGELDAFIALSNEKYGVKTGGAKGNAALLSFDGRLKIMLAVDEGIVFGEQLQAARDLIDECIAEWSDGARPELCALINSAFQADKSGNASTTRVLGLRRLEIADPRWRRAMEAIDDAIQVTRTKRYVRFYRRTAEGDAYEQIALG